MSPIVIRPRRSIAARDAHSRDARVRKDNAGEGETRVPRRGRGKAAEDQPSVGAETLDARTGLAVPVFIAGSASVGKVNVGKDSPETTYFCRDSSIGARHEEQGLGDVAVHWSEQPLRAKGAKDAAVRRIVEKRNQAALRPTRRGCQRELPRRVKTALKEPPLLKKSSLTDEEINTMILLNRPMSDKDLQRAS